MWFNEQFLSSIFQLRADSVAPCFFTACPLSCLGHLPTSQCPFQVQLPSQVPGFSRDISLLSQTLVPVLHGFLFPGLLSSLGPSNLLLFQPLPCVMFILILKSPYLISFFYLFFNKLFFSVVSVCFFFPYLSDNLFFFKSLES